MGCLLPSQPAIEAQLLVEDARWPAFRDGLLARRGEAERRLLRRGQAFETMTRLAGEISAIDYALGLPAELASSDPSPDS